MTSHLLRLSGLAVAISLVLHGSTAGARAVSQDYWAGSRLPDDVLDLGDVFSGEDEAIYWDTVHTNEVGADLVAQRLVDDLWDRLEDPQGDQ